MTSFLGFCDDAGHAVLDDKHAFSDYMREKFSGKEFVITVLSRSALRSLKANNYYWSQVVAPAAKESGQSADTIHTHWCREFLPNEKKRVTFYNRLTGQRLVVDIDPRRSSKQTGNAFYDYVENCRLWCQEWLGVTTEDPDPDYWRKRKPKVQP